MLSRLLTLLALGVAWNVQAQTAPATEVEKANDKAPAAEVAKSDATPSTDSGATSASNDGIEATVMDRFKERFGNVPINQVRQTPFNLFEVQMGQTIVYVDENVRFVMDGHLIDAESRRNLTQERLDDLAKIDFEALPFELAIKQVRGDGSRRIALFEDPNCGYCKLLRKNMEGIDNLTVYTFLMPILSADSTDKVRDVWCAENPGVVWDDWMLRNQVPQKAECDAPIAQMLETGRDLLVQGTPAIFFEDGSRVPGVISKEDLLAKLQ
ncbi:DsbC family protein [Orrella sp. 11846]|uniref:DsbC family protein n=1 Tax=Orrella sp. 11846 TaxID=3409913 RepID=UPI003B5CC63F